MIQRTFRSNEYVNQTNGLLFFTLLKPLTDLVLFEQRRAVDLKRRKREAAGVGGREGRGEWQEGE
jgi:hypothetical protein